MKNILTLLVTVLGFCVPASAGIVISGPPDLPALETYVQNMTIVHDGSMMNSMAELQFIKAKIAANQEPWKTYYTNLTKSGYSKLTWTPHASAVPTNETDLLTDSYAAYNQALLWYLSPTPNVAYAQNARTILNAWSSTVQSFSGITNWYLMPAWASPIMASTAELLRNAPGSGWTSTDTAQLQGMFNRTFLPLLKFRYAYGNRELSVCNGLLAIGIFNDDKAAIYMGLYHWVSYVPCYFYLSSDGTTPILANYFTTEPTADVYWTMHSNLFPTKGVATDWIYTFASSYPNLPYGKADDKTMMTLPGTWTIADQWYMGSNLHSIPNPVPAYVEGQCAETFRDLGHAEFAFAAAFNVAELAWHQGIDLYSNYASRFAAAMELESSFRLSNPLPPALANSGVLTANSMPATFEIAYNHFHDNLGVNLPNTLQLLPTIRSELWYTTTTPSGIFANALWGQEYYHIDWESLLHQGLPPESFFPTQGLVAYYQFEQNTNDSSGTGNNGTAAAGFSYSSNHVVGAYSGQFDGAGGRVVAPDSTSLEITGGLTLATWVYPNSLTSNPNLIAKSFNTGYRLRINSNGTLELILGDGSGGTIVKVSSQTVPVGIWSHVAATVSFSGATATLKFYVNGTPDPSSQTFTLSALQAGTGSLVLGIRTDATSSTEALNGLMDETVIYNRALSDTEIAQLAQ